MNARGNRWVGSRSVAPGHTETWRCQQPTTNKDSVFVRESVLNIVDQTQHSTAPQAAGRQAAAGTAGAHKTAAAAAGGEQEQEQEQFGGSPGWVDD